MKNPLNVIETYIRHWLLYDAYVVSYPKCGRTWLNSILLHYVRRHYDGISEPLPFQWAPPMVKYTWYRRFPNICFTHDISSPAKPYRELHSHFDPTKYIAKHCVLLVRDPRDVLVSHYHHSIKKTEKNNLPQDMSLSDFIHNEDYGIQNVVAYYNLWVSVIRENLNVSWCTYEELRTDTANVTRRLLDFFKVKNVDIEALKWAVEQNAFDSLQKREVHLRHSRKLDTDKDKLRVRRGKVGGYREEMTQADMEYTGHFLNENLHPLYGYS